MTTGIHHKMENLQSFRFALLFKPHNFLIGNDPFHCLFLGLSSVYTHPEQQGFNKLCTFLCSGTADTSLTSVVKCL